MPAKDIIHTAVRNALIKDGWTITHDPYTLEYEDTTVFVDLGAERVIAAERAGQKIAVEIKSFIAPSVIHAMEEALGQYVLYQSLLEAVEPDRHLYLAVSLPVYENVFARKAIQLLVQRNKMALIVVNLAQEEVVVWTN